MRTHAQRLPKADRITWRRHFPVWVGLELYGRHILGVYVRVGDRMRFFESDRQLATIAKSVSSRR